MSSTSRIGPISKKYELFSLCIRERYQRGDLGMDHVQTVTYNYTCEHVRENAHIGIPITTSTDVESLAVPVGNVINQFNLGSKLVGITSDGGTNLVICKPILKSTFDNMGVFDLENPIFVME